MTTTPTHAEVLQKETAFRYGARLRLRVRHPQELAMADCGISELRLGSGLVAQCERDRSRIAPHRAHPPLLRECAARIAGA